jgi:hypothetical protein
MNREWVHLGNEIPLEGWLHFAWKIPGCSLSTILGRAMNLYAGDYIVPDWKSF